MLTALPGSLLNFQITILVAAEGVHKLPVINSSADLKEALQKLGSIPSNKTLVLKISINVLLMVLLKDAAIPNDSQLFICLQAVEVLWTPQNENDTLSQRELLEDYPLLRPL